MTTATTRTDDKVWAEEQFNSIEPTADACFEFDMSEDGIRYHRITGITMTSNLGFWGELTTSQRDDLNARYPI